MRRTLLSTFIFFITIISAPATAQQQSDYTSVSPDVKYQYIGTYDVTRLNSILTTEASGFSDLSVTYSPAIYSANFTVYCIIL